MRFTAREDIGAPIEAVFAEIADFEGFERAAMRRGAEVARLGGDIAQGAGARWQVQFDFRNRARRADLEIVEFDRPNGLSLNALSSGLEVLTDIELLSLSRARTRLTVSTQLAAQSIAARLLLQSLKLARSNLTSRYQGRVSDFAKGIEARHG